MASVLSARGSVLRKGCKHQVGEWFYIPDPDETVMTFQVGMVGTNGILLASDKLAVQFGIPGQSYRDPFQTDKIVAVGHQEIAYCCAGDRLSTIVGKAITEDGAVREKAGRVPLDRLMSDLQMDFGRAVEVIACEAVSQSKLDFADKEPWDRPKGGSLLLAYCRPEPMELWKLDVQAQGMPHANRIRNKCRIGDSTTPASFFSECYYHNVPIEDLILLAAHTVFTAGAMNPDGVDGLDILLCRPSTSMHPRSLAAWCCTCI